MNMNMKNEKTMLALVLVAALAMVSVAGVALASESDGATSDLYGTLELQTDTTADYFVYGAVDGNAGIIVPEGITYSGTVSFGVRTMGSDGKYAYTTYSSVTLEKATGISIMAEKTSSDATSCVADMKVVILTPTVANGSVDSVTMGENSTLKFASATFTGITGTYAVSTSVECANAVIGVANVSGITVKYDNGAMISGTVAATTGNVPTDWNTTDDYYASVTVSGTAYYTTLSIGADVELVIAENAVLSSYTSGGTGVADVMLTLGDVAGTGFYAIAIDNENNVTMGTDLNEEAKTVKFNGLDTSKTYTVYVYDAASGYVCGTLTLGTTPTYTANSVKLLTEGSGTTMIGGASNTATPYITYTNSSDTFVKAFAVDGNGNIVAGVLPTETGRINFNGLAVNETAYNCVVLLTKGAVNYAFIGKITVSAGTTTGTYSTSLVAGSESVLTVSGAYCGTSSLTLADGDGEDVNTNEYPKTASKMTINGTLNLSTTYGTVTTTFGDYSTANIGENGKIVASAPITAPNSTSAYKAWDGLNAAYYSVTANNVTTYYYTTLATAMKNASQITVLGYLVITDDTELTGNATVGKNKFIFAGTLVVGNSDKAVTVTLLSTSTATYNNSTSVEVVNGKYITVGIKTDSSSCIKADAFVSSGSDGIYTDLATALDTAVSGDKILLRQNATLSRATTVIDGVTLDATSNAYNVTVKAGASLTIVGTAKLATITVDGKQVASGTTPAKAAAILTVNSNNVTFTTLNVVGVVNMGATDLKLTSGTININSVDVKNPVIFNITGTVNNNGVKFGSTTASSVNAYVTWNVSGTVTNKVTDGTNVGNIVTTMNVTGAYIANSNFYVKDLTVTGNGSVTIAKDTNYTAYVLGKLIVGTETKDIAANTNNATVIVTLSGNDAVAYVYGNFDDEKIIVTATNSATFIIKGNTYCTIYGDPANNMTSASGTEYFMYKPVFTNYTLVAWYSDESLDTIVTSTPTTADGAKYYADVIGKSFSIKVTYIQNGTWIINDGKTASGLVELTFGDDNTVSFTAADGYTWTGKILVNDKEMPANYIPKEGDVFTVSAEPVEKEKLTEGMDLVTILLIIITIVIVIMAIIIALKLMRS